MKQPARRTVKRRKLKWGRVLFVLVFISFIIYLLSLFWKIPIKNIFVSGNEYLSDQKVLELSEIENYPSSLSNTESTIKKRLQESPYIKQAEVVKVGLSQVNIMLTENKPLFYYMITNQLILLDGTKVSEEVTSPRLLNYTPEEIYHKLVEKMGTVNRDIWKRISDIEYTPNDVDAGRFMLYMNDGNAVYITLSKIQSLNNYLEIIRKLNHKKGILYLDAGEYFQIME